MVLVVDICEGWCGVVNRKGAYGDGRYSCEDAHGGNTRATMVGMWWRRGASVSRRVA